MKQKIQKILIANRGEIAVRIIRTCKKMGIQSVAVFSDIDINALHVQHADEAYSLPGSLASDTYLRKDLILEIAKNCQCDAIHPGYGFLSENPEFAQMCAQNEIIFLGPSVKAIREMGSKSRARTLMQNAGIPTVSGFQGSDKFLTEIAKPMKYPILLKAAHGGGGKGMRVVRDPSRFKESLESVKREAQKAFGSDEVILEKYFDSCKHIEVQVLGDLFGNIVHLFERECSLQRRHQKIIEESPAKGLSADLRKNITETAVKVAQSIGYKSAGTVEFILMPDEEFYFLEMNTRLQVEHPVTEMITGIDLVEWQIKIAEGISLPFKQKDIVANGHAIECRLYAEDPQKNFLPATGQIHYWNFPEAEGFRCDSGIETNSEISAFYDPILAKVICHGEDRLSAIRKMNFALDQLHCLGIDHNKQLLKRLVDSSAFEEGQFDTRFVEDVFLPEQEWEEKDSRVMEAISAALLMDWGLREKDRTVLKQVPSGWRNSFYQAQKAVFSVREKEYTVEYRQKKGDLYLYMDGQTLILRTIAVKESFLHFTLDKQRIKSVVVPLGDTFFVQIKGSEFQVIKKDRFPTQKTKLVPGDCIAPMPGQVVKLFVKEGQKVEKDTPLLVLSAMKMENTLKSATAGTVEKVFVTQDQMVESKKVLIKIQVESNPE